MLKKTETDIKIYLQLQNQDVLIANVIVFPPEITDIFGEETLKEAKRNPDQLLEKSSCYWRIMTSFCLTVDQI